MELIGQRFGHIRVTEVVGQGGMGHVYAGYDETLERKVAVKVLNPDQRLDADARERLLREARALSLLDHPNICRIFDYLENDEADLLVLEYIDGTSLDDSENLSRSEKLRIASAIASVLVAAHRAGIAHRDLKPENVMLTKSGEVKVLDFGLARWLHRARGAAGRGSGDRHPRLAPKVVPMLHARSNSDTLLLPSEYDTAAPNGTAVGVTLGTPLYMSPEQARGDTLTSASDMYSFGLLLQKLFTGADPHPAEISAREIILRVARGETNPVTGVPHDVANLIGRLKQFAPADRLTAVEALERLESMRARPQRFVRRAIAAVIVAVLAIGGWRYMADLQYERARAIAAQAEAEKHRAQLEEFVEFMLGDLRRKLEPVGSLAILDDVGTRAIAYVDSLDPAAMDANQLTRSAKALNQVGDVRLAQGKSQEAMDLFRRSMRLVDAAVQREPRNPEALRVQGATHFWIGNSLRLQGENEEALRHMRAYMQAGDTLATIDPAKKEYQLERAYGHSAVALILQAKGQLNEALEHYTVSLRVKEKLASADPSDADAQAELARAYNKVAVVLYQTGDLRGALGRFEREIAAYRSLVARDAKNTEWLNRLATAMAYHARLLHATGDPARAAALWQEELQIERRLAERDPTNVSWQRSVAVTERRLAISMAARGDFDAALPLFRSARKKIRAAIQQAPTRTSLLADEAAIDIDYAVALAQSGEAGSANELLRSVIHRLERLPPADRIARLELARSAYLLGDRLAGHSVESALQMWERAEREFTPFIAGTQNPLELDLWMRILLRRGRVAEARTVLAQIRRTGYAVTELDSLCREAGC
jgi:eukaryotic-like serine/threonine-protein kinase